MHCPQCNSERVQRFRRRGVWDQIRAFFGRWPYRCRDCGRRFTAAQRYAPRPQPKPAVQQDAQMAFRKHSEKPIAKIVVQADNHEQLNHILLALNRAVSSYQTRSSETTREKSPQNR